MLRPKKKVTKKELKQDPVVSTYVKATSFYYENKKYISYVLTTLVVIIIASVVYANNRRASNEKAAAELGKVFQLYDDRMYQMAIDGVPERGMLGLKAIVENYSGPSAELARFYLADSYYKLGKYDEALQHFEKFSGGDDLLQASALAGAAACYEVRGEHSKAAKLFEKAFHRASESPLASEYLHHAAYNYGKAGEGAKAVDLLKRLKKDYPTSLYTRDADRYITQFSM